VISRLLARAAAPSQVQEAKEAREGAPRLVSRFAFRLHRFHSAHLFSFFLSLPFHAQEYPNQLAMEATVVVVDNSEWTRNGDYAPTRFQVRRFI